MESSSLVCDDGQLNNSITDAQENEDDEGVACGFLVDKINTLPFQKALERGEIPFCAFAPISTQDLYILKLQDCSDNTRHMLVPALKEEVLSTPGALKNMNEGQEPGSEESMNYRVAIVAIARQVYNEELKQLDVIVDPLIKKDKRRIQCVKFLTVEKFADFAFLGFDGNVSEFANKNENNPSKNGGKASEQKEPPGPGKDSSLTSPPPPPQKEKTPPRAPARRGRGGRRRMSSRHSPPMPSTSSGSRRAQRRQQPHPLTMPPPPPPLFANCFQTFAPFAIPHDIPSEFTPTFIKMEPGDGQAPQYFTRVPIQLPHNLSQLAQMPDPNLYTQEGYAMQMEMPRAMDTDNIPVPIPFNEVTLSSADIGSETDVQQANHDILTIAFDQLVSMTGGSLFPGAEAHGDRKEGRRPGRKPRRKPLKERNPMEDLTNITAFGQPILNTLNGEVLAVAGPKRRGRPPKNRQPIVISGQENEICENSNPPPVVDPEEFEKYSKCPTFQQMEVQDENTQM